MRQFLEKNGDRLHFCLFFKWTMVSSLFSWTMGIKYYSSCFVKTIKNAHLSWRAHLSQGWLQTHTHTQALWAWTPKSHHNQGGLSSMSSVIPPSARTVPVPMLPSDAKYNAMSCCSPAIAPLSVYPIPRALWCLFLHFHSSQRHRILLHALLFAFIAPLVPFFNTFFSCSSLKTCVELLPPERVVLFPPEPCSLASLLSSPLVSQFKRVVFCWINKLDQFTKWFDVV